MEREIENSVEFMSVLSWCGSPDCSCGCGRLHSALLSSVWSEEEVSKLRSRAHDNPGQCFVYEDKEDIMVAEIANMRFVKGCPCGQLVSLEKFVWTGRKEVLDYYKLVQDKMERENITMKETLRSMDERLFNDMEKYDA